LKKLNGLKKTVKSLVALTPDRYPGYKAMPYSLDSVQAQKEKEWGEYL